MSLPHTNRCFTNDVSDEELKNTTNHFHYEMLNLQGWREPLLSLHTGNDSLLRPMIAKAAI